MDHDSFPYSLLRCEVCGIPWAAHTPRCPRHYRRPLLYGARAADGSIDQSTVGPPADPGPDLVAEYGHDDAVIVATAARHRRWIVSVAWDGDRFVASRVPEEAANAR